MKSILLLLLLASSAFAEVRAVITGPEQANPGDLVVLSAAESVGDNYIWIQPQHLQTFTCDSKQLAFAVGTPGSYTFTLVAADKEAAIDYTTHTVVIGKPTPTPTPTPAPVPNSLTEISRSTAPNDPDTAFKIVENIESTISFIQANQLPVTEVRALFQANIGNALALRPRGSQANWMPWRKALEAEMTRVAPTTQPQLITAYKAVAAGL